MKIVRRNLLAGAEQAEGIAIVIDVLRAFTCSALMFHYGLEKLTLVRTPEEALTFREKDSRIIVAGEVDGVKVPGFDIGNSPAEIVQRGHDYFGGRQAVLRSSAGTQGVIAASQHSQQVILGSFVTASAIARYLRAQQANAVVSIVAMGLGGQEPAIEDEACADYLEHLLAGKPYDPVATLWAAITNPYIVRSLNGERAHMPREDVIIALQRDLFDFVLVAENTSSGHIVARRVDVG